MYVRPLSFHVFGDGAQVISLLSSLFVSHLFLENGRHRLRRIFVKLLNICADVFDLEKWIKFQIIY